MAQGVNGEEFDIATLKIDSALAQGHALRAIPPSMLTTAVEVQGIAGQPVARRITISFRRNPGLAWTQQKCGNMQFAGTRASQ
jgi:hypothetical protein